MNSPAAKPSEPVRTSLTSSGSTDTSTLVFDLSGTLKRLGDDRTILADLVKLFREDSPGLIQRLQAAADAGNCEQVQHSAHSLRGLAANFGAAELIEPLKELEERASQGSTQGALPLVEKIKSERTRLEAGLLPYE